MPTINKDGSVTVETRGRSWGPRGTYTKYPSDVVTRVTKAEVKVLYATSDMCSEQRVEYVAGLAELAEAVVVRCVTALAKRGLACSVKEWSCEDELGDDDNYRSFELTPLGKDVALMLQNISCEETLDRIFA